MSHRGVSLVMFALTVGGAVLMLAACGGSATRREPAAARANAGGQSTYGPPGLATYQELAPHVASSLTVYGVQGGVRGAPSAPESTLPPLSAGAFTAPVARYLAYSGRRLGAMEGQISALESALAAGDRPRAQSAWRGAYADYLDLGGVYLEGPVATLNQAIDGGPGGLAGGVHSRQFTGLHRLEYGLWTGATLASLQPWARRLASDVAQLRRLLPHTRIAPLDYATRAHEILEDAVRDLLSGTDVPWSGEGVLGTNAGVAATKEIIGTLSPLLRGRETVLPTVQADLRQLTATLRALQAAHGGRLPTNAGLSRQQSEQLDAAVGQALEGLAQVPGALETTPTPSTPSIPRSADRVDP